MTPSEHEEKIRGLVRSHASSLVNVIRAIEGKYGEEGKELARQAFLSPSRQRRREPSDPSKDLHEFCDNLERGCRVTHEWTRVVDEPNRVKYIFSKCMWAEAFRSLDAADIGHWFCDTDEPAVRAYNPKLGFRRTKVMMEGDEICDHDFFVEST